MPLPHFDSLAEEYARYRTGYSEALFDRVLAHAPPRPGVLDIAAGTGLSTRGLAPRAARVVATDIGRVMLARNAHGERVLARSEALPFRAGAFGLVTIGQAFHWVDARATYREVARVLQEDGACAIWWKLAPDEHPVSRAIDDAFARVVGKPAPHTEAARRPLPDLEGAELVEVEDVTLPFDVPYTVDAFVGYHASRENLRRGAGTRRDAVLAEMRRVLLEMFPEGRFVLPYEQRLHVLRPHDAVG